MTSNLQFIELATPVHVSSDAHTLPHIIVMNILWKGLPFFNVLRYQVLLDDDHLDDADDDEREVQYEAKYEAEMYLHCQLPEFQQTFSALSSLEEVKAAAAEAEKRLVKFVRMIHTRRAVT